MDPIMMVVVQAKAVSPKGFTGEAKLSLEDVEGHPENPGRGGVLQFELCCLGDGSTTITVSQMGATIVLAAAWPSDFGQLSTRQVVALKLISLGVRDVLEQLRRVLLPSPAGQSQREFLLCDCPESEAALRFIG